MVPHCEDCSFARKPDRQPFSSPVTGLLIEHPRASQAAFGAASVGAQAPNLELVPIALDKQGGATRTQCTSAHAVMNIAGVYEMQTVGQRNVAGSVQGARWRVFLVQHFPIRVECREMHRHIRPEFIMNPSTHLFDFAARIILSGDQQRGNLEPDLGFALEIDQRLQDGLELAPGDIAIKTLGECLQIHVRRVDAAVKFHAWFSATPLTVDPALKICVYSGTSFAVPSVKSLSITSPKEL